MLTGFHEGKTSLPVDISTSGDNIIVTGDNDSWIYVHEIIGSAAGTVKLTVKSGTTSLAEFDLTANQGITLDDIPGDAGVPRFEIKPGSNFILNLSGAVNFVGSVVYSRRY